MSDPAKYRKKGELEEKKTHDCIDSAGQMLKDRFGIKQAALDDIKADVEVESQDAYKFADESEIPDPSKLYDYTYAE
jgi:pyruvate dehydrogenase E1 component alpha subunit